MDVQGPASRSGHFIDREIPVVTGQHAGWALHLGQPFQKLGSNCPSSSQLLYQLSYLNVPTKLLGVLVEENVR